MIDKATVDKILDTAEIVDVVSEFVSLRRRGANYIACCPFHNEKTPSFSVSPTKGIFKCFGCGKAGSAVTFIMEHEQMTYTEALKYLGKKYGIEVYEKEETPEDAAERLRHESLLVVSEYAQQYFQNILFNTEIGRAIALSYFQDVRGFSEETIKKFGLGYAPDTKNIPGELSGGEKIETLAKNATRSGYKREFLIGTGLCIERGSGELVDKFYDRVMFPIHSLSGRVIAFGGRTLKNDKEVAKYVNSPETEIYHKSNVLYGIYQAKSAIAKLQKCYLVEGYADVISMNQAGVENVVASSGTSLTSGQIRLIKRFTNKITVLYDGDAAGIKASLRGIDMLLEEGMEVKVALIPDGHDPDDFARSHSRDEIISSLNKLETDFIDFKYELLAEDIAKDPIKKAELIKEIIRTIALIPDQIVRSVYVEQTSTKLDVKQEMLIQEVNRARRNNITSGEFEKKKIQERREEEELQPIAHQKEEELSVPILAASEKELLYYLLKFGESSFTLQENRITVSQFISSQMSQDDLEFQNKVFKTLYNLYFEYRDEEADQEKILRRFVNNPDEYITKAVMDIVYQEYTITVKEYLKSMIPEENVLCMMVPKAVIIYKSKITEYTYQLIMRQLGEAQANGDEELQKQLLKQIKILTQVKNQFSKELNRLT